MLANDVIAWDHVWYYDRKWRDDGTLERITIISIIFASAIDKQFIHVFSKPLQVSWGRRPWTATRLEVAMRTKGLAWAGPFALCMALLIGCRALPEATLPTAVAPLSAPDSQSTRTEPVPSATPSLSTQAAPTTTAVGRLPTREPQSTRLPAAYTPTTPPISWIHS